MVEAAGSRGMRARRTEAAMFRRTVSVLMGLMLVAGACSAQPTPSGAPTLPTAGASLTPGTAAVPTSTAARSPSPSPTESSLPTPSVNPSGSPDGIGLLIADVPRAAATLDNARSAAAAINAFGVDLLRQLQIAGKNAVFSPASVALALGMTRAGAAGTTASQMDTALGGLGSPAKAAWLDGLDQALATRSITVTDGTGVSHQLILRIANAPFAQRGMTIQPAYLNAIGAQFGAGLRVVDYRTDSETARQLINGWVDDQTQHRIAELLARGTVTAATRLTLVNAIYLKAPWTLPFDPKETHDAAFRLAAGGTVDVPVMVASRTLPYAAGSGWSAVDLGYLGDQLSLTLILPNNLSKFTASLDGARLADIVSALTPRRVDLELPRFSIETHQTLADPLRAMGMTAAFDPAVANFSGITTEAPLAISEVIHQANITVDESGTEAAAATAVVIGETAGPPSEPVVVHFDQPFLFALRDRETGAVLFLGQVVDPSIR
jgi:serpin B